MKPKKSENLEFQADLFKTRLDTFLNMRHQLVKLSHAIDWTVFDRSFGSSFVDKVGRPGLSTRLVVALHYLKHLYNVSDESVVEQFLENAYWQYFCGFETFQKDFPCDPSSLSRFRKKLGEDGATLLLQNSLATAMDLDLLRVKDCTQVIVDTTVQPKNISHPTDAKLLNKVRSQLVEAAKDSGIELRQSYCRVGKNLLFQHSKYIHAKQFKRARKSLRKLKTYLRRVMADIKRKIDLETIDSKLKNLLELGQRIYEQNVTGQNKIYSLHEPQVECIAKGKAHKPYEFGCKAGIVVTAKNSWILGAKAYFGRPYDGSTLKNSIEETEKVSGININEVFVDKGYRGKTHHPEDKKIFISGRKKLPPITKKLLRRRSSIEPVIGHLKHEHRLGRNYLKGYLGDRVNVKLAACGFNLRKILREKFNKTSEKLNTNYFIFLIFRIYQKNLPKLILN